MKKSLHGLIVTAATAALLLTTASTVNARDRVDWSINIGVPVSSYSSYGHSGYVTPAQVYRQPHYQPYHQPQQVYVQPAPVYYPSHSTYVVPAQPYGSVQYSNHARPRHWDHGHRGHGRGHEFREHRGHRGHHGHYRRDR
ncbi:MAG: hypothetical protein V4695_12555 [Pseudomonadota bacterium]